jgi:hypothetical protein
MTMNITLSAEEKAIQEARIRAQAEHTSLNVVFRDWLNRYASGHKKRSDYSGIMERLSYAQTGTHFSRDDLNER